MMDKLEEGDEHRKHEYMQSSGISVEQARVFFGSRSEAQNIS